MASNENSFVMKWSIKNFSLLWKGEGLTIHSPEFSPEHMGGTKWRLRLSSQHCVSMTEYIHIQLLREDEDDGPSFFNIRFEISFQALNESPLILKEYNECFRCGNIGGEFKVKWNEVILIKKDEYLPEDTLTVCCKTWSRSDSVSRTGRFFVQTIIGIAHLTFYGILKGFSSLVPNEEQVVQCVSESPERGFVTIKISLNDQGTIYSKRIEYFLNSGKLCTSKLHLIDNTGNKVECIRCGELFDPDKLRIPLTMTDLIDKKELYVQNDTLTFQFQMIFSPGIESEEMQEPEYVLDDCQNIPQIISNVKQIDISKNEENLTNASEKTEDNEQPALPTTFKDDMISFYNESIFHDVQLHIGTETVPAHRDILRARSPVFRRMFATDMKEKASDCISITDLNLDTLKRMLLFLYTDTTGELELQSAKELYFASEKYGISSLKRRCSISMKQNLQPSNVCEILALADAHQDKELKSAVQEMRHSTAQTVGHHVSVITRA
ncbi:TD and POZ domain-containing protein 2 [Araneus ventricosus]|uniref:TD and POZ domain-containing protein 2 n=1 Tax=Araneus ventricosus TaxID=182803 RepID=A0A4Y2UFV4_ARAVE|nr:TD and POZ domain-containing protein 2 [Araneus ventricosus]